MDFTSNSMDLGKYHEFMPQNLPGLSPDASSWTVVALALAGVLCFFMRLCLPKHYPQEPVLIPQGIPYIGHVVGMIKHGFGYYKFIHDQFRLPIYTLKFMSSKVYVITSLETVKISQKSKTLGLTPFINIWLPSLYGLDRKTVDIMKWNQNCERGKIGYMHENYAIHHEMLSPGHETLTKSTEKALNEFANIINHTHIVSTDLHDWVRHVFTVFITNAVWGSRNPIATCPNIEKDFWMIEEKFHLLLVNIFPKWTSSGGYRARENVTSAFRDYYKDGIPADVSNLVRDRAAIGRKYGFTTDALARIDIGMAQAFVVNTIPISVWMLLYIFSSPSLLDEIRSEVLPLVNDGNIDPSKIRNACPALSSTWHEVLRFTSFLPQGRTVIEDTMLDDRFLLTKGATVVIPPSIIHGDTDTWGPDAAVFDPHRFMPDRKKAPYAAFRGFGSGTLMCPGRHFAATVVLAFVSTMVVGFDIIPEDGRALTVPERDMFSPSLGVLKPVEGREVRVQKREGWENVVWGFSKDAGDASEVEKAV